MAAANKARGIASVKKRIVPVSEAEPHVKVLLYGRNGKGKTRVAATAPKCLIIDINEKGTKSVRNYPGVEVFPVRSWQDITYAYWYLKEGDHDFESVVVDTLTQAQTMCMQHVLKNAEDRDPNRPPSMPMQRDWGQMTELMKPIILNYRNLPMNVIFVCQERTDKRGDDDESAAIRFVPDLSPGVRAIAMAGVEVMGRIYRKPVRVGEKGKKESTKWEVRMLVGDHDDYETKDRTGNLGHIVRNPTIPQIIEASSIEGEQ